MLKTQDHKKHSLYLTYIFALFLCFLCVDKVSAATVNIGTFYDYSHNLIFSNSYTFSNFSSSQVRQDIESFIEDNESTFIDRYYSGSNWLDSYNYICVAGDNTGYYCYVQLTNAINDIVYASSITNPDSFFISFNYEYYSSSVRFTNLGFAYNFYLKYDSLGNLLTFEGLTNLCPATNLCGRSLLYKSSSWDFTAEDLTVSMSLLDSYNNKFYNYNNINTSYFTSYYSISQYYKLVTQNNFTRDEYNSYFQNYNKLFNYDYSNLTYLYYHNDYSEGGDDEGGGDSIDYTSILDSIDSSVSSILTAITGGGTPESPNSFGSSGSYSTNECIGLHCITSEYTPTFTGVISGTMSAIQYLFYLLDYVVNLNAIVFNMILVCLGLGIARLVLGR